MTAKILCVDDEPFVLTGLRRQLSRQFQADFAEGAEEALALIDKDGPYGVVLSDMRMPGMDGIQLLATVMERSPDTVRMMLTGNEDQETAKKAVNEGNIYRFLSKPCPPDELAEALRDGLRVYELRTTEKELLEKTLGGSIEVLTEIISILDPESFGRMSDSREVARNMASELHIANPWEVEAALLLSQLGTVVLPKDVSGKLAQGKELTQGEQAMMARVPDVGADLVARIPRMEQVAEMIRHQNKSLDQEASTGARILTALRAHQSFKSRGLTEEAALARMRRTEGVYDPKVLEALSYNIRLNEGSKVEEEIMPKAIPFTKLRTGNVLAAPIETMEGSRLIRERLPISTIVLERLKNYNETVGLREPILIYVKASSGRPLLRKRRI